MLSAAASAQAVPPAVPVEEVEEEPLAPEGLVVLELFSSQACVFCPKADRLLGDLIQMGNVIGLACHVDYFDVGKGSLSQPFCGQRQTRYESTLRSGPNYTPQLVMNGTMDAVGYRLEEVSEKIRQAAGQGVKKIEISREAKGGHVFNIIFPAVESLEEDYEVWLVMVDRPHQFAIAEGGNRGQSMAYTNIATMLKSLSDWDGKIKTIRIDQKLEKNHKALIVLAQNRASGQIVAAGQYVLPESILPVYGPVRRKK